MLKMSLLNLFIYLFKYLQKFNSVSIKSNYMIQVRLNNTNNIVGINIVHLTHPEYMEIFLYSFHKLL